MSTSNPNNTDPEDAPEPKEARAVPVFYDARSRRWPWFLRLTKTLSLFLILALLLLGASLIARPLMPAARLPRLPRLLDLGNPDPQLNAEQRLQSDKQLKQDKQRLKTLESKAQREAAAKLARAERERLEQAARVGGVTGGLASALGDTVPEPDGTLPPAVTPPNAPPIVAAFYVNWEETSFASASRNIGSLTHLIPEWLHLKRGGQDVDATDAKTLPFLDARTPKDTGEVTQLARTNGVAIVPMLNNYTKKKGEEEGEGMWDTQAVHVLVADPTIRASFVVRLRDWLTANQCAGINIDFEQVAPEDGNNLVQFMKELYAALHPRHLIVTQDTEVEENAYHLHDLAQWNDWIIPMFYDQHAGGTPAGPVAGVDWVRQNFNLMLKSVPANKIVFGVGAHGYDWPAKSDKPTDVTYQGAIITALESDDARITLDKASLNPHFTYTEEAQDGQPETEHSVWMEDATTAYNVLSVARPKGIRGAALWMLGSEDPSLWAFYNKTAWPTDWRKLIQSGALNTVTYGSQSQVDFEGDGELLRPLSRPNIGQRTVQLDAKTGLITAADYNRGPNGKQILPSAYVVRRFGGTTGNTKKQIVLTFDDGPDPEWTPQILDILHRYHVPAVFFVVGKQAEENPDLIRRMWDEGHEIGNHSWSHPDMFKLSDEAQRLQLTSTQRVIQALTGRTTTLFRPPYGGDTEPTTAAEVAPMEFAAEQGYTTVGEKNDPNDWRLFEYKPNTQEADESRPRTADDILKSVLANRDVGSTVLLHDAGGDRSRTIAALPQIIEKLRADGYTFVSVGQLINTSRDALMPPVRGRDVILTDANSYLAATLIVVQRTLTVLFTLSVALGLSRVVLFVGLALIQRRREKRRVYAEGFAPPVSVIIAAYNEEKVIARTIRALLEGEYTNLEVLVVDDGSKDDTFGAVEREFADNPKVRVFRKPNGGKATALNYGIARATGDILVSLDADTLFASDTVSRLARHFANPKVGAVSGNVRVGNTINIYTRWQSLEYTTSQNFDRRGYDLLNCITVVPGAVGALRLDAVRSVGGYTHDTLAEDTDLTWKLRRAGWRITNDNSAMAYTEAPESLRNLAKQRFRWAFGTLQCLWKHRSALFTQGAFGWLALPSLWLYQILFPAVSPFMDVAMLYALIAGGWQKLIWYYLAMVGIEFLAAFIALRMDKGNLRLLPYLFLQRFVYRQLMYYVVLKSLVAAIRGGAVGWNKFERTGTAQIEKPA